MVETVAAMAQHSVIVVVKELVDGMVCHRHCDLEVALQQSGIERGRNRTRRHSHCRKGHRVCETLLCSSRLGRVIVVISEGSIGGYDHNEDVRKEGIVVGRFCSWEG